MPGKLIEVLRKTDYNFSAMVATQTIAPIFVAEDISVAEYREVTLQIRWHDRTMPTGSSVKVEIWQELPSPEDPGKTFRTTPSVASVSILAAGAVPLLYNLAAPANVGAMISISISPITAGTAGTFTFTTSMALSAKS